MASLLRGIMNRVDSLSVLRGTRVRGIWDQEMCFLTLSFGGGAPVSSFPKQTSHSSIRRCRIIIENLGRTCCAVTEAKGKLPD